MTIEMKPKKQKKILGDPHDSEPKKKKVKFAAKTDVDKSEPMDHSGIENKVKDSSMAKKKKKSLANKIVEKKNTLKAKIQNGGKKDQDNNVNDAEKKAELKEKKKKLKEERRKKEKEDGVFDIGIQAKQVWEEVRREDCPEQKKAQLLLELHSLVKGKVNKLIYAHDTVRVIECLVALGEESIRDALYEEMKDELITMAKSKYASFFVQKLVKYGTKVQRDAVFKVLEGRVSDLTKHKIANSLVETCYNDYCNAAQRNRFIQEFYGPEFKHFKEDDARTVVQLMQRHPEKRRDLLKHLASNVDPLVTKGCYNHSLVHTVLYNYMLGLNNQILNCPAEKERREKERSEFVNMLRDICVHIVHSHDGARLTMNAIWYGTAKDRKAIIKSFKTYVPKIAKEEFGYLVLIAILDCVDDTKLTAKAILGELTASDDVLDDIIQDDRARKVFLYAMVGRNKTYFHPDVLSNLGQGDGNPNSKKEPEIRRKELADNLTEPLAKYIDQHLDRFLSNNNLIIFLKGVILNCSENSAAFTKLLDQLAKKIVQPFEIDDGQNLIESGPVHMFTKKILTKGDFGLKLLANVDPTTLKKCLECNRGAYLLVAIIENVEGGKEKVQSALKSHLEHLKKNCNTKGAELLKKKLE